MNVRLLLGLAAVALCAESRFHFRDISPETVELTENGQPVFAYNHGVMLGKGAPADRARCCYVHPLYAPGGVALTDDFPADHYHHRGAFWTWPIVEMDGTTYDGWLIKGVRQKFRRWIARETDGQSARLAVENGWFTGTREIVRETVEIIARPAGGARRELEFRLRFEALDKPVILRGEPVEDKGYGGFCVRFAPREKTVITTPRGREAEDSNMVPLAWAQLEAEFAGHPAGLRIDIDPLTPGYPNGWCLRHYGFLGANFPGLESYTLEPGEPLEMRFKVTVFSGRPEPAPTTGRKADG
ncbi:MAG: PmoA family protein [Bryobacteraceae bacterium]|nr:PmoA family protein [Bryobacteraceae bacterium]